jgi:FkbM family methyltransferase
MQSSRASALGLAAGGASSPAQYEQALKGRFRSRTNVVRMLAWNHEAIVSLKKGFKLLVKRVLMGLLGYDRYLFWFARLKIATLAFDSRDRGLFYMLDRLEPDATVLDIGANLGVMTVQLARRVPNGKVHAFEPEPSAFHILTRVVASYRLQNVVLHNCALGNRSGEVEMITPVKNSVRQHGNSMVIRSDHQGVGIRFRAPVKRLDDLASIFGSKIQAIKLDVEGNEPFVIEGGHELIASCHPMMYVEFWPKAQPRCFKLMNGLGYDVLLLTPDGLSVAEPSQANQNFLCIAGAKNG